MPPGAASPNSNTSRDGTQNKRRLGSALTARDDASRARELALRVLTHNIMLLAEAA